MQLMQKWWPIFGGPPALLCRAPLLVLRPKGP
nr:MAG TPA: hypothetical protein [Caudoviricetes sp.]